MTYTTLYLGLRTVIEGGVLTAGNTSQVSDVALACVLMDGALAAKQNVTPLVIYTSISVTGCEPDEMGIGPKFAVPKLLKQHRLTI